MIDTLTTVLEQVHSGIRQGSVLDQIDKIFRKQQRINLFEKLETIDDTEIENFQVVLYKSIMPNGKKKPALLRFYLPSWKDHDEIFWHSLGDYVILAMHRVTDVEFDSARGRMKIKYFPKIKGRIKHPEDIRVIIQKIAYLVDTEGLPTDFTRFRRMTERRGSLGEMSKEQAALIGAALKLIQLPK
ncbi:MAG TPA: hypothetical protein DCP92_14805 [Nitrospiraceae bacterium]|jgi:hypothetical protein|nr:hypothetical protein [Nitrospiraceae bacterium]